MFKLFSFVLTGLSSLFGLTVGFSIGIALGTVLSVGSVFVVTIQDALVEQALHANEAWHAARARLTHFATQPAGRITETDDNKEK